MNQSKKELSYFRLKLEGYLRDHHPELMADNASFLEYYSKIISLAGLERLTGVNQGQLSHYLTGKRKPSAKTTQKIQRHLHAFGKELQHLEFA